jgi:hypothetical protein
MRDHPQIAQITQKQTNSETGGKSLSELLLICVIGEICG